MAARWWWHLQRPCLHSLRCQQTSHQRRTATTASAALPTPPPRCRCQHRAANVVATLLAAAKLKGSRRCYWASASLLVMLTPSCRHCHQAAATTGCFAALRRGIVLHQRNAEQWNHKSFCLMISVQWKRLLMFSVLFFHAKATNHGDSCDNKMTHAIKMAEKHHIRDVIGWGYWSLLSDALEEEKTM